MNLTIYGSELLFTEALAALLGQRGNTIVACPERPEDLIEAARSVEIDACLIDASPSFDVNDIRQIKHALLDLPVVVLLPEIDPRQIEQCIEAGVNGICLRVDSVGEIESVLSRVERADQSPGASPIWSNGASTAARRRAAEPRGTRLTPKEHAVLQLLILGTTTSSIATELQVSEATVRTHLQHMFGKFGVHSRVALVAAGINSIDSEQTSGSLAS